MFIRTNSKGKQEIYDLIRKKYVSLTPEEKVRQFVINFLNKECKIPLEFIGVEGTLTVYNRQFRTDLRVFNTKIEPILLIECKRPEVELNDVVLEQAMKYRIQAKERFLLITNGLDFKCFEFVEDNVKLLERFPTWDEINWE